MLKKLLLFLILFPGFAFASEGLKYPAPPAPPQINICDCHAQFGADWTGTSDSTTQIQKCVTFALTNGLNPYLPYTPNGFYKISSPILMFLNNGTSESPSLPVYSVLGGAAGYGPPYTVVQQTNKGDCAFWIQGGRRDNWYSIETLGELSGTVTYSNSVTSFATNGVTGIDTNPMAAHYGWAIDPANPNNVLPVGGGYTDSAVSFVYNLASLGLSSNINFINCMSGNMAAGIAIMGGGGGNLLDDHITTWNFSTTGNEQAAIINFCNQSDGDISYSPYITQAWYGYDAYVSFGGTVWQGAPMAFHGGEITQYNTAINLSSSAGEESMDAVLFESGIFFGNFGQNTNLKGCRLSGFIPANQTPVDYLFAFGGPAELDDCLWSYSGATQGDPIRVWMINKNHLVLHSDRCDQAIGNGNQSPFFSEISAGGGGFNFLDYYDVDNFYSTGVGAANTINNFSSGVGFNNKSPMLPGQRYFNRTDGNIYMDTIYGLTQTQFSYNPIWGANGTGSITLTGADVNLIPSGCGIISGQSNISLINPGQSTTGTFIGSSSPSNCQPMVGAVTNVDASGTTLSIAGVSSSVTAISNLSVQRFTHLALAHAPTTITSLAASGASATTWLAGPLTGSLSSVWSVGNFFNAPGIFANNKARITALPGGATVVSNVGSTVIGNGEMYDADMVGQGDTAFPGWTFAQGSVTLNGATPVTVITYIPNVALGLAFYPSIITDNGTLGNVTWNTATNGQIIVTGSALDTSVWSWKFRKY